eukprot:COSAG01_NODE_2351_length_7852_cov_47.949955_8_plen_61_part_00
MQWRDDIMEEEAELSANGWTDRERAAFKKLFGHDIIEVPWDLREESKPTASKGRRIVRGL